MFKILLVDDEPIIKIGVRKLLEGTDYIIAGTASNGSEALLFLETNSVDIILTDLKMPVMDGIELIRQLQAIAFEGAVLVLSNYSEFELVREALTEGAADYILKTDMTRAHLLEHMEKISQNLCFQNQKRTEAAQIALKQEQNTRKLFLSEIERVLFTSHPISCDIQSLLMADCDSKKQLGLLLISAPFPDTSVQNPFLSQLQSLLPDIFSEVGPLEIIWTPQNQFLVLFLKVNKQELIQSKTRQLLRRAELYFKKCPNVSFGTCDSRIQALRNCYKQCQNALRYMFYLPEKHLFPVEQFSDFSNESNALYHFFSKGIIEAFRTKSVEAFLTEIRGFFSLCSQHFYDPDWVRSCCCRCCEHLMLSLHTAPNDDVISSFVTQLTEAFTVQTLQSKMVDILSPFLLNSPSISVTDNQEIIRALTFIDAHYMEPITLEEIAKQANLNKSYLCRLFKQETNISVFAYVNQVRMRKAAQLLASKNSSLSIGAVASEVGIDDAFYFARKFKYFSGMPPREFRKEVAAGTF